MNKDLLKENRVHGDAMYPISVYSIDCSGNNILDCHWHDEMEFLIVTEGRAIFQIGTSYYNVCAGQAIIINSGEIHAGYRHHNSICSFNAVVFSMNLLCSTSYDILQEKFINPIMKKQYLLPPFIQGNCEWEKEVLELLNDIVARNKQEHYTYELVTKAQLYLILSKIFLNYRQVAQKKAYAENNYKVERLKKILNYIQVNYSKKITLKDLADLINMSESHFCRFFKQMVKKTPIDYLNYIRIRKAAELLENSDKKIFEIAMDVGFDNLNYLIIVFKKHMGCTPSKYRKLNNSNRSVSSGTR